MFRKLFVIGFVCLMSLSLMTLTADAQQEILGPYLWMIAPTEGGQGGQNSTNVDSLAAASDGKVTEEKVANNGAKEGNEIGDYKWTEIKLPANGDINTMLVDAGVLPPRNDGNKDNTIDDITSYALIMLKSSEAQPDVTMRTGSDDSIKVWLNGEDVFTNARNRGRKKYEDAFKIDLIKGENLLMVKVSERGGGWGMYVGIEADVDTHLDFNKYLPVEPISKLTTKWAQIKSSR